MEKKAFVTFDDEKCKACGICVAVCPQKIIEIDKSKINTKGYHPPALKDGGEDSCTACAMCAVICPHVVIKVEK